MAGRSTGSKIGVVSAGFIIAFAFAWVAVNVRQHFTPGPEADASAGMYAAGDAMLGVAIFALLALVPLALGLYWLRPVTRFWSILAGLAIVWALTGVLALIVECWFRRPSASGAFLADVRIGLMPLSGLAFLACALFSPHPRPRLRILTAPLTDGLIFTGIVLIHFILPGLRR